MTLLPTDLMVMWLKRVTSRAEETSSTLCAMTTSDPATTMNEMKTGQDVRTPDITLDVHIVVYMYTGIQGGQSGCTQCFVDIKLRVAF